MVWASYLFVTEMATTAYVAFPLAFDIGVYACTLLIQMGVSVHFYFLIRSYKFHGVPNLSTNFLKFKITFCSHIFYIIKGKALSFEQNNLPLFVSLL